MQKRWVLKQADESCVSLLSEALKVSPVLARILAQRSLTAPDAARRFLSCSLRSDLPSPFLMAGMSRAVERLAEAIGRKEPICIWGDYDVDGTTGTSALVTFLKEVGCQPIYYIPHRIDEGYGLNAEALRQLSERGIKVVVSVDCGVSNYREVEIARDLGIDVIIVDHHELPELLPPAVAILNPHRPDCFFPDKGLSGAGLAFYLIIGLRAKLREIGWFDNSETPDIRRYLDIVTLGTIADMVPLRGVNRVLSRRGLVELGGSTRPGIIALKQVAGISGPEVGVAHVAFRLGPRINAAGRMDAGLKVVEMLTTDSTEEAVRIAQELDDHNRERQATEAKVLGEALARLSEDSQDRYSIVLGQEGWHPGVLGIVASRIVDRFHRPTVVVGFDQGNGKGSARSIRGFHMVEGLRGCADCLEKFGGHEYAGGLSIRADKFSSFIERFEEMARGCLTSEHLVPVIDVDDRLDFSQIGFALVREIEGLQPFGIGNPEPLFMTREVQVSERRDFSGGARLRLRHGGRALSAVVFGSQFGVSGNDSRTATAPGLETLSSMLSREAKIDIVYRLGADEWSGTYAVELRLVDARPSTGS
ncbi:MAG TPA: single-stranded-DNA-specific exonuclease RecJ [Candidatus Binatia bacterium]|nr:single-stranded-DNA-specific exonuclease RecJ [Candidatus Binatia bacterium]